MRFTAVPNWPTLPEGLELVDVVGLAIDGDDNLFVFSRSATPVVILDSAGRVQAAWGGGMFTEPHGIALSPDGFVFCVDYGDHTVRRFTVDGQLVGTIGTPGRPSPTGARGRDWTTIKRASSPFNAPTDAVVGPNGDLYISDGYGNARIHRFTREGALHSCWGEVGDKPGDFNLPHSIELGGDGVLYVSDRENSRIQCFDLEGGYLSELRGVHRPDDALPAWDGCLYVAELGYRTSLAMQRPAPPGRPHSRLTVFGSEGELLVSLGGEDPTVPGSFCAAHTVVLDSHGDIYIGDVGWSAHGGKPPRGIRAIQKLAREL